MTKQVILVGEIRVGERGAIHQADFASAIGAERLTSWPKNVDGVQVVVGKLLAGRKPALLVKAETNGLPIVAVADVLDDTVKAKLIALLTAKPKRETYEQAALDVLAATAAVEPKPSRKDRKALDHALLADILPVTRGKKSKAVANE